MVETNKITSLYITFRRSSGRCRSRGFWKQVKMVVLADLFYLDSEDIRF